MSKGKFYLTSLSELTVYLKDNPNNFPFSAKLWGWERGITLCLLHPSYLFAQGGAGEKQAQSSLFLHPCQHMGEGGGQGTALMNANDLSYFLSSEFPGLCIPITNSPNTMWLIPLYRKVLHSLPLSPLSSGLPYRPASSRVCDCQVRIKNKFSVIQPNHFPYLFTPGDQRLSQWPRTGDSQLCVSQGEKNITRQKIHTSILINHYSTVLS